MGVPQLLKKLEYIFFFKANQTIYDRSTFCELSEPTGNPLDVVRVETGFIQSVMEKLHAHNSPIGSIRENDHARFAHPVAYSLFESIVVKLTVCGVLSR
jgi:hypothetical protein